MEITIYSYFNHKHIFIKIRHDIIKQCHRIFKEIKKFNYNLEIEISRNSTQKKFGCPERFFLRVWVSKKAPRRPAGIRPCKKIFKGGMVTRTLVLGR